MKGIKSLSIILFLSGSLFAQSFTDTLAIPFQTTYERQLEFLPLSAICFLLSWNFMAESHRARQDANDLERDGVIPFEVRDRRTRLIGKWGRDMVIGWAFAITGWTTTIWALQKKPVVKPGKLTFNAGLNRIEVAWHF